MFLRTSKKLIRLLGTTQIDSMIHPGSHFQHLLSSIVVKQTWQFCPQLNLGWLLFFPSYFTPKFLLFLFKFLELLLILLFFFLPRSIYKSRSQDSTPTAAANSVAPSRATGLAGSPGTSLAPHLAPATCQGPVCRNGGTCRSLLLPGGAFSFQCDCPLHFTGRFCERGKSIFIIPAYFLFKTSPENGKEWKSVIIRAMAISTNKKHLYNFT